MQNIQIGENRLIPKGTKFWSVKNQTNIMLDEDSIVEVVVTYIGSDVVLVKQKELLFNRVGCIPGLITKGVDEWEISYSQTLPYTIPEPTFLKITYENDVHE
jgi:hypothetical protein